MKKSQIDKALDQLEYDKQVIELAIAKLRQQQSKPVAKRPRPVPVPKESA